MKIQNLEDLESFVEVARSESFSQAARDLRVPVSVVSKRVARLEESLGLRLLQRSTRAMHLTEEGKTLVPQIQRLFGDIREMEEQFSRGDLKGPVRMTLPFALAQGAVAKILAEFSKAHPLVEISVHFSDSIEKLVEGGFDLAIRFTSLQDSSLIARRLGPNYLKLVASLSYLKIHGTPRTVTDLRDHSLLVIPVHREKKFMKTGLTLAELAVKSPVASQNGPFLTEMTKQGAGIAVRSHWDVSELLRKKELVEITLDDRLEPGNDAFIVTPSNRYMSPRVRALMDTLVREFPRFLEN